MVNSVVTQKVDSLLPDVKTGQLCRVQNELIVFLEESRQRKEGRLDENR